MSRCERIMTHICRYAGFVQTSENVQMYGNQRNSWHQKFTFLQYDHKSTWNVEDDLDNYMGN